MPANNPAEIHTLFRDAFNARDIEAMVALYEPTAVLVVGGQLAVGSRAIRDGLEIFVTRRARMTLETRSVITSEAAGLAVLHGAWILEPVEKDAGAVSTQGLSTEVVRRQEDGTWLFIIDNPSTPR
jgi:uncharacterized protein (TIGR02246 family)